MMKRTILWTLAALMLMTAAQASAELRINEAAPSCSTRTITDADGKSPDWIELINDGAEPVNLADYSLTNDPEKPERYVLPEKTLAQGETCVIYCDKKDGELHAPFKLDADKGTVLLKRGGETVDSVSWADLRKDTSIARTQDGQWQVTWTPTPGAENVFTEETKPENIVGEVCFNEVLASAAQFQENPGYDWIELKNTTRGSISLKGWKLTLDDTYTYTFGNKSINGNGYVKLYMESEVYSDKMLHSGFSLPAGGAVLKLFDASGKLVSQLAWTERLPGGVSYGRPGDSGKEYRLLAETSLGSANTKEGYEHRAREVKFDTAGGYYDKSVTVSLTSPDNARIYYTTNGSVPTAKSTRYTGPFTLTETTVVRAVALSDDLLAGQVTSATYFIGSAPGYCVVSITIPQGHLTGGAGMFSNSKKNWQYPTNVEYFDENGVCQLNQLCSMGVSGEVSRQKSQKSMVFFARSAYGKDTFSFNPFPNRDYKKIKSFVLRNSGSESVKNGTRFKDALFTGLAMNSACNVCDARPVLVYINGEVWGHMNIRERANKYYFAALEGVPDDQVDDIDILVSWGRVNNGSNKDYLALRSYIKKHDLNDPEALAYVESRMDIDSFFDCAIYNIITGNSDLSNYRFYHVPGGKWKWMLYDFDNAMGHTLKMPLNIYLTPIGTDKASALDQVPFVRLMEVPAMRDKFLTRMAEILMEDFTAPVLTEAVNRWHDAIAPMMTLHCKKWTGATVSAWEGSLKKSLKMYIARPIAVVGHVQKEMGLTNEEVQHYFGEFLAQK